MYNFVWTKCSITVSIAFPMINTGNLYETALLVHVSVMYIVILSLDNLKPLNHVLHFLDERQMTFFAILSNFSQFYWHCIRHFEKTFLLLMSVDMDVRIRQSRFGI